MKLVEVFNSSYEYKFSKEDSDYKALFSTKDGSIVKMTFEYWSGPELYNIEFGRGKDVDFLDFDITNDGDAIRIFATVLKIISEFAKEHSPKFIRFVSSKHEKSRISLYQTLTKKLSSSLGYVDITDNLERADHRVAPNWMKNSLTMYGKSHPIFLARKDMIKEQS